MKEEIRSPITWYGGKFHMSQKIIEFFPKHQTYVEVFGGAAHILFKKEKSAIEIYNDLDEGLVNFFEILRNEEKAKKLISKLKLTPYSRKEHEKCLETWNKTENKIEKARRWYVSLMQSFSGQFAGSWAYSKSTSRRGMSSNVSKWLRYIDERILKSIERLRTIQIENLDFRKIISKYDNKDTLFYLDPPYVHNTRVDTNSYDNEMTNEDHRDLMKILENLEGKFVLSGYDNPIYNEANFNKKTIGEYSKRARVTSEKNKRTKGEEIIWFNFNPRQTGQQKLF